MGLFDRFRRRRAQPAAGGPSSRASAELGEFLSSRDGVEAFLEPRTAVYATTLCLVAGDGEYLRRPVTDVKQARSLCAQHGVPLYDAAVVGYPKRMRDYDAGVRQRAVRLDELPPLDVVDPREGRD